MSDDKVVVLYPEKHNAAENLSDAKITARIVQLIRVCDAKGIPICVVVVQEDKSHRWVSQQACDKYLPMVGALDEMIDSIKNRQLILTDEDCDEDDAQF